MFIFQSPSLNLIGVDSNFLFSKKNTIFAEIFISKAWIHILNHKLFGW